MSFLFIISSIVCNPTQWNFLTGLYSQTGVANILINEGFVSDLDVIQAAILHDTVEDTETTEEELRTHFGDKVI